MLPACRRVALGAACRGQRHDSHQDSRFRPRWRLEPRSRPERRRRPREACVTSNNGGTITHVLGTAAALTRWPAAQARRQPGPNSDAIGFHASSGGDGSSAYDFYSVASALDSAAVGPFANAVGDYSLAAGHGAYAKTGSSVALGRNADAIADNATAVGPNSIGGAPVPSMTHKWVMAI